MTEAEWLAATDPTPMLEFLRDKASVRKLRLTACACCYRIVHLLIRRKHEPCRRVVEVVEAVADGRASELLLPDAWEKARAANGPFILNHTYACALTACVIQDNIVQIANYAALATGAVPGERIEQCRLVRDIFGNPFRPVAVEPSWLTSTVVQLAEGIYSDRAFDRLPILADALQDAGCDSDDILNHCRQPGEHVRGCWVVDLLTGRE